MAVLRTGLYSPFIKTMFVSTLPLPLSPILSSSSSSLSPSEKTSSPSDALQMLSHQLALGVMNGTDCGDIIRSFWNLDRSASTLMEGENKVENDPEVKVQPQSTSMTKKLGTEVHVQELIIGALGLLGTSEPEGKGQEPPGPEVAPVKVEEKEKENGVGLGMTIHMSRHKFMPLMYGVLVGIWRYVVYPLLPYFKFYYLEAVPFEFNPSLTCIPLLPTSYGIDQQIVTLPIQFTITLSTSSDALRTVSLSKSV